MSEGLPKFSQEEKKKSKLPEARGPNHEFLKEEASYLPASAGQLEFYFIEESPDKTLVRRGHIPELEKNESPKFALPRDWDPQKELKKILAEVHGLPKAEQSPKRRELMAGFLENWGRQRQGIVLLANELEETIALHWNLSDDRVRDVLEKASGQYGFSDKQRGALTEAIRLFRKTHEVIGSKAKYFQEVFRGGRIPWQERFFKHLFGFLPDKKVELQFGPMSLVWILHSPEDYARAYGKEYKGATSSWGAKLGGLGGRDLQGLEGAVTIINAGRHSSRTALRGTIIHETHHVVHDLVTSVILREGLGQEETTSLLGFQEKIIEFKKRHRENIVEKALGEDKEKFEKTLRQAAKIFIGIYKTRVRDEILAYLVIHTDPVEIKQHLTTSALYGYLHKKAADKESDAELFIRVLVDRLTLLTSEEQTHTIPGVEEIKKIAREILEDEYRRHLKGVEQAILVASALVESYPEKMKESLYLLMTEPIDKWSRLLKIFLEPKAQKI